MTIEQSSQPIQSLLLELKGLLGSSRLLTDPLEMAPYCQDWRGRYQGQATAVVLPKSTEEVAAIVKLCGQYDVDIVPQGGNTGLCGGATPLGPARHARGEILVSLTRMNRIRAMDIDNATMTVEAGCTLAVAQQAASEAHRLFPLSLAAEGTATIGGNLSTNAGGVQVLRYGNARELCLGLEVVLPDGQIWNGLRGLRKDNTGYDLKHLFIGAEGTLGLITVAVLKLFPQPRQTATAWVAVTDPQAAVQLLSRLKAEVGDVVTAFELIDRTSLDLVLTHIPKQRDPLSSKHGWYVLIELATSQAAHHGGQLTDCLNELLTNSVEENLVADAVVAQSQAQSASLWALRENIAEAQRLEGLSIKHDVSLPISALAAFIETTNALLHERFSGVRIVCFGHLGDGNLHYNQSKIRGQDNGQFIADSAAVTRIVHDQVQHHGGSISAEHGIGQLKITELGRYKSELDLMLMRKIKMAFDPEGRMNPGKVLLN